MRAMVLEGGKKPLLLKEIPKPSPQSEQLLIKVEACGICRTDLHILDEELPNPHYPLVPGHQIVGIVEDIGDNVHTFKKGDRVGIPWLGYTCGKCAFCLKKQENLCDNAKFTGYTLQGGFADYTVADNRYCFLLSKNLDPIQIAPLLCAGLIGFRAFTMVKNCNTIGFYGFGASAHILLQIANYLKKKIYVFTRVHSIKQQELAKSLGAEWIGNINDNPPKKLEGAIIFAPDGSLIPLALGHLEKGGLIVSAGIHMSDIPSFSYKLLWEERKIQSIANLTREDGREFFKFIEKNPIVTKVTVFQLEKVNEALNALREGKYAGAIVLSLL